MKRRINVAMTPAELKALDSKRLPGEYRNEAIVRLCALRPETTQKQALKVELDPEQSWE